jgi:hypothetical protein
MSGVSAVGEATVSAGKWVIHESLGPDDELHTVLPDEDLECLSKQYGVSKRDLIRANSLNRRSLRAGQSLIIPHGGCAGGEDQLANIVHPNESLALKAVNEHDQDGVCRFTLDYLAWSENGSERFQIAMTTVHLIRIDVHRDALPDLMSAKEVIEVDEAAVTATEKLIADEDSR